jgi:hypothetical protein
MATGADGYKIIFDTFVWDFCVTRWAMVYLQSEA